MTKIQQIQEAIAKAECHESKMDETAWSVPALSSLKIRHLMNNLGAISTMYLEHGTHRGGLFCSTIRNNENLLSACAVDNYESDETNQEGAMPDFLNNVKKCMPLSLRNSFLLIRNNSFDISPKDIYGAGGIDLYLYDAHHSYEAERQAVTHFLPAMADTFIMCKDDWQFGDVKRGTLDGLVDSGCEILFQQELLNTEPYTEDEHRNSEFWRGFYVALLKKK